MFLGAGKLVGKGLDMYQSRRAASLVDEGFDAARATTKQKGNFGEIASADNLLSNKALQDAGYDLTRIGDDVPAGLDDTIKKGIDFLLNNSG